MDGINCGAESDVKGFIDRVLGKDNLKDGGGK